MPENDKCKDKGCSGKDCHKHEDKGSGDKEGGKAPRKDADKCGDCPDICA